MLPEIDKAATIKNTKNYFKEDFPRLVAQSHINLNYIRSPRFDNIGSHDGFSNDQENRTINNLNAKDIVIGTMQIINNFPDTYKVIIKSSFINGMANTYVCELVGYRHARLNELKNESLLYFADAFTFDDLHVYKRNINSEVQ